MAVEMSATVTGTGTRKGKVLSSNLDIPRMSNLELMETLATDGVAPQRTMAALKVLKKRKLTADEVQVALASRSPHVRVMGVDQIDTYVSSLSNIKLIEIAGTEDIDLPLEIAVIKALKKRTLTEDEIEAAANSPSIEVQVIGQKLAAELLNKE